MVPNFFCCSFAPRTPLNSSRKVDQILVSGRFFKSGGVFLRGRQTDRQNFYSVRPSRMDGWTDGISTSWSFLSYSDYAYFGPSLFYKKSFVFGIKYLYVTVGRADDSQQYCKYRNVFRTPE